MSNDEPKLTIFVSSMIGPLWDERAAVEEAIRTGIPLARTWVFERAPASSEEITESYLARVRECDIYLLILGEDISDPVKAEYQTAVECDKPRLCFVQEGVKRTEALEEFLLTLQDGVKYATFRDEASLRREVLRAVRQELVQAYKRYRLGEAERAQLVASTAAPSPRPIPFQLPRRAVHFQGREQELVTLLEHLRPGAAVTLCGPGGIGKTALAAEALARLPEDRFPDGIIFHTFYYQPEATLALEHIARSYGQEPRPTPADAARMALAGRRALLVLDGAEEADDLGAVLACAGGCGVLITSRARGDAPDPARRFDLGALEEIQAVALLQAWGGKRADDEEAAAVICRLVGGLPLAIQLAGAYLARTDEEAANYLVWLETTPLAALDFGQRQRDSVPLTLERSLERVSERARAALGLVGLMGFAPFGREAIAAGLGIEEGETGRVLGALVDYGLLVRRDGRYAVTHALVYTYTRQRLSPGEEARERLAAYYLALVQDTGDHAILNVEQPHLLAALAEAHHCRDWRTTLGFVGALGNWLDLQGHWMDQLAVLGQALDAARALGNRSLEGAVLGQLGIAYFSLGQMERAIEHYTQALLIDCEIGDRQMEGAHLGNLGNVYVVLGQVKQAIEHYTQALLIARETGDRGGEGARLGNLGLAYARLGQVKQAIEYHSQALEIAREISDRRGEGVSLGNLGNVYFSLGQVEQAIEYYQQALAIAHEIGSRQNEGNQLGSLGDAYYLLGQMEQAIEHYTRALQIAREIGDRLMEKNALGHLGDVNFSLGQVEQAIEHCTQALLIAREIGDRQGEERALGHLGNVYFSLGEVEQAIEYHQQALDIAREIGDRRGEGSHLDHLGNAYTVIRQEEQAIEHHTQALEIAREIGNRVGEGQVLGNLGNAYLALEQVEQAIKYHQQALEIHREIGNRRGEGQALGNLGTDYRILGQVERAIEYYTPALAIAREIGDRGGEGALLGNLGLAYHQGLGQVEQAVEYYQQALAIACEIGDRRREGALLSTLGNACYFLGHVKEAIEHYTQALEIHREFSDRQGEGTDLGSLGLAYANLGQVKKAIEYYTQALEIARKIGDRQNEGAWLGSLGLAYLSLGDTTRAHQCLSQTLAIFEEIKPSSADQVRRQLAEVDVVAVTKCRREWCQHVQLLEKDTRHTQSSETMPRTTLKKKIVCARLGHESLRVGYSFDELWPFFKGIYCLGCTDRSLVPQEI